MSLKCKAGVIALFACVALVGCGGDDSDEPAGGSGGSGGSSGTEAGSAGTSGDDAGAGSGGSGGTGGTGGTGGSGGTGGISFTCSEELPTTPVTCGGTECPMPAMMGGMDTCQRACCVADACGIKSTNSLFPSECAQPGVPDPSCPMIDFMGMELVGCCNAGECGFISQLRGGICATESPIVTLPDPLQACGEGGGDDAGAP
jgi:hypothetical protein